MISDGSLKDLNGAATLDDAFTTDPLAPNNDAAAVPAINVKDALVIVEPVAPDANTGVTVRWTEVNEGTPPQGHVSTVAWFVDNQWIEPIQEVIAGPMQQGEEAERNATLVGVVAGEHLIYVTANADGNVTGSGAVPAAGLGQIASTYVRVGGGMRPEGPDQATAQAITNAGLYIGQAITAVSDPSSVALAAQALYSFAGALDTGGEATTRPPDTHASSTTTKRPSTSSGEHRNLRNSTSPTTSPHA